MNEREKILNEQRQNATPEERQIMALEGIHDMMAILVNRLANVEGSLSSLADNAGQISSVVRNPNFLKK